MPIQDSINYSAQPGSTDHISAITKQRTKASRAAALVQRYILVAKYFGFILTFMILMAVKVVPDFEGVTRYNPFTWGGMTVFTDYALFMLIIMILHIFMYFQHKLHSEDMMEPVSKECISEFRIILTSFMITLGITFLLKTTFLYSRFTLVLFVLAMIVESGFWILLRRSILAYLYRKGSIKKNIVIVGAGKVGLTIYERIMNTGRAETNFIGYLDDYKVGAEVIGKPIDLETILQLYRVDVVYITIPSEKKLIESLLGKVYKYDVDIKIIPEMFDRISSVFAFKDDLEYPCLQIVKTPLRGLNVILKRMSDVCGSLILLTLMSPLFLLIGLLVKLESKGPIFFRQQRLGKNGLPFYMLKFRSMKNNAESIKSSLLNQNEMSGPVFKLRNDPRITRVGQFIRKYSIDELPQLWNVLRGQMSLIGPRPPLPDEVSKYSDYHWRRMDVLPGMTGLWQVSGRSDLSFEEWIDLDIYYIEHWSFMLEMKILLKTIPVVIKGAGAY